MRGNMLLGSLLLATGVALAEDAAEAKPAASATEAQADAAATEGQAAKVEGPQVLDGMSVLGNQEAPKSLVIVPWKSSQIGDSVGIAPMLDDSRQPVDKDVFLRALSYYQIKAGKKP